MLFRLLLYPLGKGMVWLVFRIFGPIRVSGREWTPRSGGLLVCANHISDADPPTMFYAIPRPVWFMAKEEIFGMGLIGWVARTYRAFPVKRGSPDRTAIRRAEELLTRGECVVIFPEGECSETGEQLPLLPGVGMIVQRTGVRCICAGIVGSNTVLPYGKLRPQRSKTGVQVTFGEVRDFADKTGRQGLESIVASLAEELAQLTGRQPAGGQEREIGLQ